MSVAVTARSSDQPASRTIVRLDPGKYTVVEQGWSWAYGKGTTEVTPQSGTNAKWISSGEGTGTGELVVNSSLTFTFGGDAKTEVLKHDEDVNVNSFQSKK